MLGQPTIAPLGLSMYPTYMQNHLYQTDKVLSQILTKIAVRTYRRQTHSKILLRNRSIWLMHLFATITKPSVIKHARVETLANFFKTVKPEQGSDSCTWRNNRGTTPRKLHFPSYFPISYCTSQTNAINANI